MFDDMFCFIETFLHSLPFYAFFNHTSRCWFILPNGLFLWIHVISYRYGYLLLLQGRLMYPYH